MKEVGRKTDYTRQARLKMALRQRTVIQYSSPRRDDGDQNNKACLYGWRPGASHKWYSDRSQRTVMNFDKPQRNGEHPTMKPVALFEYQMCNSTKRGDVVLDMFAGSGTTVIAAERTGRLARVMELDPKYCDVIRRRWAEFVHGEDCDWQALTPAAEA